jgi:AcrR family transcriptional regulator
LNSVHARAPKQSRSRESFDRVIKAAIDVLMEGDLEDLTLAEVSRRSRVSIGSIYGRVESKEDLIRVVQAQCLVAMEQELSAAINRIRRKGLSLRELVPAAIREFALFLRRHMPLLKSFMERARQDETVGLAGRKAYLQSALDFKLLLLERRSEFHHPDPDHAAETCFVVVYGVLARYLGLGGMNHTGAGEGDWNRLIEDLGLMTLAFLVVDLKQATRAVKAPR